MKCYDDGHKYEIQTFMTESGENEEMRRPNVAYILSFYQVTKDGTRIDGITTEGLLEMLIDRTEKMNEMLPCEENLRAIDCLKEGLLYLEKRTHDRIERNVEGTHKP